MSNRPFLWAASVTTPTFQSLLSPTNTCAGERRGWLLWTRSGTGTRAPPPAPPHLPVVASGAEGVLGQDAGPDVEALLTVPEELQLLAALHLLPVVRQDEEGVRRHRVQGHVLWGRRGRPGRQWAHQQGSKVSGALTHVGPSLLVC